ncbi:MAG: glycosyltransferase family 2 protein [Paracoccaceae bacterium]|nr:glycosyltransferase family 2 protein [Paracoccaceae bacterium]
MNAMPGSLDAPEASGRAPDLSIVVISYNTRQMTLACLASVAAETRTPHEVIVVDNASTDGSAEAIAAQHPDVTLIAETENHGFGPAHEIAMARARAPWVLLLNPDTVILDGAVDRLLAFARRTPEAGIWGGRTLYGDGSLNPTSCFRRQTLWSVFCRVLGLNGVFRRSSVFNSEYFGNWQRNTERAVDIVTGCFLMIRRETWDALGGFDPAFTMYGEEVDLCLRAEAAGHRPRVTPEATIIHYGGASQPVRADKMVRLLKAKIELIKRHFPPLTRPLGVALFRLWPLSRALAFGLAGRLPGGRGRAAHGKVWAETWARRAEWRDGFSESGD